jgi:hypothetical protein
MISSSSRGLSVSFDKRQGCVFGVVFGLGRNLGKALASAGDVDALGRRLPPWRRRIQALLLQNLGS